MSKMISIALFAIAFASLVYGTTHVERQLIPAFKKLSILTRGNDIKIHTDDKIEIAYALGTNLYAERNRLAKVTLTPRQPALVLEEVEHLFDSITCSEGAIVISAPSPHDATVTADRLKDLVGGHIITSHDGCNAAGERRVHLVKLLKVGADSSLMLLTTPTSFRAAFHPIQVQFEHTTVPYEVRTEALIRRDIRDYTLSLNHLALINQPIFLDGDNEPFQISCKNCSIWGELDIEMASFSWNCDLEKSVEDIDSPSDCISGQATASAKGVGAEVDLEVNVANTWSQNIPLFPQSILPSLSLTIPGIGSATLSYGPALNLGYTMNGSLDMSYGFRMAVPDNAKIWVSLKHLNASGAQGFDGVSVTTIPFQSKAEIQDLQAYASLRSGVTLAFNFDDLSDVDVTGQASAAVYVDTPIITANVKPVQNVGPNCQPLSSSNSSSTTVDISSILNKVISVSVQNAWDVGYSLGASFDVLSDVHNLGTISGNATTKPSYLTDMCLNFNSTSGQYQSAQDFVQQAEKATQNVKKSVASRHQNSFLLLSHALAAFAAILVIC